MGLLDDLIHESRRNIPSRENRKKLNEAIDIDLNNGFTYDGNCYSDTVRLFENFYNNIFNLYPSYQQDRIEKIMWKHDIKAALIKIRSQRRQYEEFGQKLLGDGVKGLFNTGIFAAVKQSFGTLAKARELSEIPFNMTSACRSELERLHSEIQRELQDIGVYEWPY